MGLNKDRAAATLMAMPAEARQLAGAIHDATGVPFGHDLTCSIATPVGDTDLKTMLRRLYVANGGHRGASGYDPSANELRSLYSGETTATELMAKHGGEQQATTTTPPTQTTGDLARDAQRAAREAETGELPKSQAGPSLLREPTSASKAKPADAASAVAAALAAFMASQTPAIDEDAVRAIVDEQAGAKLMEALAALRPELQAMADNATRRVEITVNKAPPVKLDRSHNMLPDVLKACCAGVHPFLVGPAGSGKTTLAKQIAEALDRPFYMQARVTSEYKLTGFIDATGKAVQTDFRRAYEQGGVFLFDEIDASDADALTAFNAPLSNGFADFPDGQVQQHPDFIAIAAGNTFGRGANREYVGRQQLDAATLDRFAIFEVDYDEKLELALAGNDDWTHHVQKVRKAVEREKVRHIVSPRASITGAKLLAAGLDRKAVEEATIWKGMAEAERNRVSAALRY
jgi:cobaltochelatase CobS